ncbi:uncharacterized protein LOC135712057 [Ochlerotatus camptorhynchus]|uniref:uncharacterized protein LOC135712057 n=1 Tax=Ochlerotatus camptorhynchus TaxID=644619 RepID=UPI0031D6AB57
METPTNEGSEESDSSIPEGSKEQLHSDSASTETGEHSQTGADSKTGKRPVRSRKTTTTADLIQAFSVANIPLTSLKIRGLVQYLQANISDPAAPSSSDQLKRCYQKYMSLNKDLVSPTFCAVQGCSTWSHKNHNYTIFPFPDCKESVKLWKQALNLTKARKMQGVCELHFDEDFLIRESEDHHVTLMPGAIPKNFQGPIKPLPSTNHCRMCGLSVKCPMTNTVSELQLDHRLRPVLDMCLELNDSKHSLLPDTVCDGCTKMVRFVGKFAETCWDAQQQLLGLYAGGMGGKKVQPWKRLYQYVEDTEERGVIQTESPYPSLSEQVVLLTTEEQVSEVESKEAPQDLSVKFDPDNDAPRLISVKAEPLDSCNSINDENVPETSNQEPPRKKFKSRVQQIDMSSGRYKKYECETCWQRLASQAELNTHTRKHERERSEGKSMADAVLTGWSMDTIKCLQCRKKFKTTEELKAHTAQEHKFEVYCPVCGIRFRNKEVLEQHRKRARRCILYDAGRIQ